MEVSVREPPKSPTPAGGGDDPRVLRMRIQAMQDIGRALSSTLDIDTLLAVIMSEVTRLMSAERSTLFLVDRGKKEIWSKVAQGSELKEIRLAIGKGVAGWVAENKKLERIDDAYADGRFDRSFDQRTGYRTRSIICAPIFDSRRRLLGVLQVLNKHGGPFNVPDEEMLTALASQIAIALENSNLYRLLENKAEALEKARLELERANKELDLLFHIERQLTHATDVEPVLEGIIDVAMKAMSAEAGSILLLDEATGDLYFKSARGEKGDEVKKLRLAPGEGIVGHVASTGEAVLVKDPKKDRRHHRGIAKKLKFTAHSIVCAPLISDGQVIGAFEVLNKKVGDRSVDFDEDDLKLLTVLSGQAARTITETRRRQMRTQEERLRTIGQAMSSVIHDFRSPMTVIGGYAQLLAIEPVVDKRKEMLDIITAQVDHMNAMVGELLGFARGETAIYKRKVYLNKFVEDLSPLFLSDAEQRKIELNIYQRYNGVAKFDPVKIKRVLTNLVRNAMESIEGAGKVTLTIEASGQDLVFAVKDTGHGIPEDIQSKVFGSFVTSGKEGGTGLGLAVCKKIIEEHGGTIVFQSRKDRGTTFTFTLPRAAG